MKTMRHLGARSPRTVGFALGLVSLALIGSVIPMSAQVRVTGHRVERTRISVAVGIAKMTNLEEVAGASEIDTGLLLGLGVEIPIGRGLFARAGARRWGADLTQQLGSTGTNRVDLTVSEASIAPGFRTKLGGPVDLAGYAGLAWLFNQGDVSTNVNGTVLTESRSENGPRFTTGLELDFKLSNDLGFRLGGAYTGGGADDADQTINFTFGMVVIA